MQTQTSQSLWGFLDKNSWQTSGPVSYTQNKLLNEKTLDCLPNGAMIKIKSACFAKKDACFFQWSGEGYSKPKLPKGDIFLLTPPSILKVLASGYEPQWHGSLS